MDPFLRVIEGFAVLWSVALGLGGCYALWWGSKRGTEILRDPLDTATITLPIDHEGLV